MLGLVLTIATANLLGSLPPGEARSALRTVMSQQADLVGLQEWYAKRLLLLREFGHVTFLPFVSGVPVPAPRAPVATARTPAFRWWAPVFGGCAVGIRADRFEPTGCRSMVVSRPGRSDRGDRPLDYEPGRVATVLTLRDLHRDGRPVALVDYHLVSGVQRRGRYREDRPGLVARHHRERVHVERAVYRLLAEDYEVYALGDSNFDGLRWPGLVSAWQGREKDPGTYGDRHIDDVHGPVRADVVRTVETESDHRALVVQYADR